MNQSVMDVHIIALCKIIRALIRYKISMKYFNVKEMEKRRRDRHIHSTNK
jgi:hypothetical protein